MTYLINLCFRAKGEAEYEHLGSVDIGTPLTSESEQTIKMPDGREVRVCIDHNHLVPVRTRDAEQPPIIYVTEI